MYPQSKSNCVYLCYLASTLKDQLSVICFIFIGICSASALKDQISVVSIPKDQKELLFYLLVSLIGLHLLLHSKSKYVHLFFFYNLLEFLIGGVCLIRGV